MPNFYVCKLLDQSGIYRADTIVYGDIEIRPPNKDDKHENAVLRDSIAATAATVNSDLTCRIGVIVQAQSIDEADLLSDERFVGVLDLLSSEYALSRIAVAQCGYIKNLDDGQVHPITTKQFGASTIFIRRQGSTLQESFGQSILRMSGDLVDRYKRSIHWSRNAKWEKNIHAKVLYCWFSVEALFKEDASDDVTGLLMLFLGFPGGTYSKNISRDLLKVLSSNAAYFKWKKEIRDVVDDIRVFRNNSVHSGFRSIDCTPDKLRLYGRLMTLASSRCQGAVAFALTNRIDTVSEFKECAGLVFENRAGVENDIIGNIVHILDNDHSRLVQRTHV